jgi:hypothetical protein
MESSTGSHIPSALATRDMSDPSGSMLQSLFDAALRDYEKQTGMKLIEHPLARKLEYCCTVESITAVLQEQARAFSEFRRDDDKVMKPLKRVVHVLHSLSTILVRRVALVATLYLFPLTLFLQSFPNAKAISAAFAILLRVRLSLFLYVYSSDVQV